MARQREDAKERNVSKEERKEEGRRDEKTGERILRDSRERKGRESGEKGDRNFSSCRKNVRALCARTGATSFLFLSLEKRDPEPRFRASRRLGEGENSVFSSPRFSPS